MRHPDGMIGVAETFASIQGEGAWSGTPMFFVRFAGCNLDCPWCDTDHEVTELLDAGEIVNRIRASGMRHVCLTGGEPMHQPIGVISLLARLQYRRLRRVVHIETNGTVMIPLEIDWKTVSPKQGAPLSPHNDLVDEVKIVVQEGDGLPAFRDLPLARFYYVVPEASQGERSLEWAIGLVTGQPLSPVNRPLWRLGFQMHKAIGVR